MLVVTFMFLTLSKINQGASEVAPYMLEYTFPPPPRAFHHKHHCANSKHPSLRLIVVSSLQHLHHHLGHISFVSHPFIVLSGGQTCFMLLARCKSSVIELSLAISLSGYTARTPARRTVHSRASARALKILGAERRPKGSAKRRPSNCMPRRRRSSGWTSTMRYVLLMSTLARRAPRPVLTTALAASSTEMYDSEQSSGGMPSLMLWPSGEERSRMRRHLFQPFFGTTPRGLT